MKITQEQMQTDLEHDPFDYDPVTGYCTRRGKRIGWSKTSNPGHRYRYIRLNGHQYYEHRLILLMMTGTLPKITDHLNGDGTDNRLVNLRDVTHLENNRNALHKRRNTSGFSGVYYDKSRNQWMVMLGKRFIRRCDHLVDAIKARIAAELEHWGDARLRRMLIA